MVMAEKVSSLDKIDSFYNWKHGLLEQIEAYRVWLSETQMASEDMLNRLVRASSALKQDELTIAFVGEFSRGKTELINALLLSDYQQRILPSKAGRTTMCPTELFYDRAQNRSYLRLLPIESRRLNLTISEMKAKPDLWDEFSVDSHRPEDMATVLQKVAEVVSVDESEAKALGFNGATLERDPSKTNKVLIPRWRHAELSFKHPLLEQGLRILDTPGLNALGSEPELTVSMIPNAQAVVFMLSADAGVTASDMQMWTDHIAKTDQEQNKSCYAVLNKIDVLWDDLQGETHTAASIERVRQDTAQRLGIAPEFVLPVSAKKALLAKVNEDQVLLHKSGLAKFEKLLVDQLVETRERLLYESAIADISSLVESSEKVITHRIQRASDDLEQFRGGLQDTESLNELADKTQIAHNDFYKKLVALRSSRRLMMSQKDILNDLIGLQKFDALATDVRTAMQDSWSTKGLIRAMTRFFDELDRILDDLMVEIRVAEKMVQTMYARFKNDHNADHLHPISFSIKKYRSKLADIKSGFAKYRRNPKLIVTEQTLVIRHFKNAFVHDARNVYEALSEDALCWADDALLPLLQYTVEQKQGLQEQLESLRDLAKEQKGKREACESMEQAIERMQQQKAFTHQIAQQLHAHPK